MFPCTKELSLLSFTFSLRLSHPSTERVSGAICRLRSIPKHWGSQRCYFSKLALSTSCRGCAAAVQGKVGNFWGPVPLVPPSLSPACSGAVLWGCHNYGLYNMGYCWRRLVTVDEAFKEASPLMVSVKILKSRSKVWLPDNHRCSNGRTVGQTGPAFWNVMGRGCSKSMFEKNSVQCIAALHYRLLFPLQKMKPPSPF